MMAVLRFLGILAEVVLLFNVLIIVHELGHYWAARWRGMIVERFAVWFGPPIWKKTIRGVEYRLGCIPAGGYVALPQMAPMEMLEGDSKYAGQELPKVSPLDRILVALAGPIASFLLAVAFAFLVTWVGRPVSPAEATTTIGYVYSQGPAARAGIQPGDRVVSVDGRPVRRFMGMGDSLSWRVVASEGQTIRVKVLRGQQELEFQVVPYLEPRKFWQRAALRQLLVGPALPEMKVEKVYPNSPAARAGLEAGDVITHVNGQRLYSPNTVADLTEAAPQAPLALTVQRGARSFEVSVTPEAPARPPGLPPMIGLGWDFGQPVLVYPSVAEQIAASVRAITYTISAVAAPGSDVKLQHLQGPVGIMRLYYLLFESPQGWRLVLWFTVVINVNLALLNLLPLPVLDGGHILLALIEWARRGKTFSVNILEWIQTACAIALIAFMVYVAFYDVQELPWRRHKGPDLEKIEFR